MAQVTLFDPIEVVQVFVRVVGGFLADTTNRKGRRDGLLFRLFGFYHDKKGSFQQRIVGWMKGSFLYYAQHSMC